MKNNTKLLLLSLIIVVCFSFEALAQITLAYPKRTQNLNQYTSIFISSPKSQTIIQNIHDDADQGTYSNSDKFYEYSNGEYVFLPEEEPTPAEFMQPGKGYIIQLGGNGNYTETIVEDRLLDFGNSSDNGTTTISVGVNAGQFNLLGNPYNNFLDLDKFLLNSNNATKVRGPIMLWSHNTVISSANINPNDSTSIYRNSANDFALYNVLGGVAAGRQISTSPDQVIQTDIQTPNGKICFGTGFGIYGIGSGGTVTFENGMREGGSNDLGAQSFRLTNDATQNEIDTKEESSKLVALAPSVRSRIWLNLEKGTLPTSGPNLNPLKQLLIGYSPCYGTNCATAADNDRVFDAETVTTESNPSIDFYSFAVGSTKHLAIQGRGDFQNNDSFKLGYSTTGGTFTITASHDGIFTTKPYYILDANDPTGQYHPLPYEFTTIAGTFDNRFKVVFENLIGFVSPANVCGSQLTNVSNSVFAQNIGASNYRFEIRTGAPSPNGTVFGEFNGISASLPYVRNLNISGIQYNTNYWLRVATYQVDGVWQYGPTCMVTSPPPPTSKLTDSTPAVVGSCNRTINTYSTSLFCYSPNEITFSTSGYRFQVSTSSTFDPGTIVGLVERSVNSFSLAQLRPSYEPLANTVYYVRVQIRYNNSGVPNWQVDTNGDPIYGPICPVTTSPTATRLKDSDLYDLEAKAYPNPFANNFKLEINTSSEERIELQVFDMIGRQIESRLLNISDLDTQELGEAYNSGVYNVIVRQGENLKTLRMIKR